MLGLGLTVGNDLSGLAAGESFDGCTVFDAAGEGNTDDFNLLQDLSDKRLNQTSPWGANLNVEYRAQLFDSLELTTRTDWPRW